MEIEGAQILFVIGAVWAAFITIFWLVIGWRAMRAHERLSVSVDQIRHAIVTYVSSRKRGE